MRISFRVFASGEATLWNVINLQASFQRFSEHWSPKIVGALNGQQVKLAKLQGEFVWYAHENEDELFLVIKGTLRIRLE